MREHHPVLPVPGCEPRDSRSRFSRFWPRLRLRLRSAVSVALPAVLLVLVPPVVGEEGQAWEPLGILATHVEDPLRNLVIDWHYRTDEHEPSFAYRVRGADGAWQPAEAATEGFPFSSSRSFSRVHLTGLEPGGEYEFRFGEDSRIYWLRMLPETLDEPLVIAAGGDTMHDASFFAKVNRRAMEHQPDLVIWGGDLSYADGREDRRERWYSWFETKRDTLIDESGRVVPVIVCIGNHEVRGGYYYGNERGVGDYEDSDEFREEIAPYFYRLFAFPGHPGYASLDFADYLSLLALDTDHSGPVPGVQTDWLARALEERSEFPGWVIPVYHVPAYLSARDFGDAVSIRVREHWVPLFDQHRIRLAFENHDHAYKRTPPLRNHEEVAPEDGTVYLGDGAWGVRTRDVHDPATTDYLEVAKSERHAIILKLDREKIEVEVVSEEGETIDRTTIAR